MFAALFDGSLRRSGGVPRGGTAAMLWGPMDVHGRRPHIAEASRTFPGCEAPAEAEAEACVVAIQLFRQHAGRGPAHVAGDRRGVMRYCAGVGRIR